jgi:6-phosphogluconolactonase (cycloisomerase 2 family)
MLIGRREDTLAAAQHVVDEFYTRGRGSASHIHATHNGVFAYIVNRTTQQVVCFIGANSRAFARINEYTVDLVVAEHADLFPRAAQARMRAWTMPRVAWTTTMDLLE